MRVIHSVVLFVVKSFLYFIWLVSRQLFIKSKIRIIFLLICKYSLLVNKWFSIEFHWLLVIIQWLILILIALNYLWYRSVWTFVFIYLLEVPVITQLFWWFCLWFVYAHILDDIDRYILFLELFLPCLYLYLPVLFNYDFRQTVCVQSIRYRFLWFGWFLLCKKLFSQSFQDLEVGGILNCYLWSVIDLISFEFVNNQLLASESWCLCLELRFLVFVVAFIFVALYVLCRLQNELIVKFKEKVVGTRFLVVLFLLLFAHEYVFWCVYNLVDRFHLLSDDELRSNSFRWFNMHFSTHLVYDISAYAQTKSRAFGIHLLVLIQFIVIHKQFADIFFLDSNPIVLDNDFDLHIFLYFNCSIYQIHLVFFSITLRWGSHHQLLILRYLLFLNVLFLDYEEMNLYEPIFGSKFQAIRYEIQQNL